MMSKKHKYYRHFSDGISMTMQFLQSRHFDRTFDMLYMQNILYFDFILTYHDFMCQNAKRSKEVVILSTLTNLRHFSSLSRFVSVNFSEMPVMTSSFRQKNVRDILISFKNTERNQLQFSTLQCMF